MWRESLLVEILKNCAHLKPFWLKTSVPALSSLLPPGFTLVSSESSHARRIQKVIIVPSQQWIGNNLNEISLTNKSEDCNHKTGKPNEKSSGAQVIESQNFWSVVLGEFWSRNICLRTSERGHSRQIAQLYGSRSRTYKSSKWTWNRSNLKWFSPSAVSSA